MTKRYALAREIMVGFCAERGISPADLCRRSQGFQAVARRRKYALLCRAAGVGRVIIGYMLGMDGSTVAAYLDPEIVERKVLKKRAQRLAQKSVADGSVIVAQQIP